jgi:hypothetical protein
MANDYTDGKVHTRLMTDEEQEFYQKRREQERLKYPWRYRGKKPVPECIRYAYEKKTQYEARKKRGKK